MAVEGVCLCCKRTCLTATERQDDQSCPAPISPASMLSCFFFGLHCSGRSGRSEQLRAIFPFTLVRPRLCFPKLTQRQSPSPSPRARQLVLSFPSLCLTPGASLHPASGSCSHSPHHASHAPQNRTLGTSADLPLARPRPRLDPRHEEWDTDDTPRSPTASSCTSLSSCEA